MIRLTFAAATAMAILPLAALAAGTDDTAPKPTETTTTCEDGKVYDSDSKSCVDAESRLLDDATRLNAARELAYNGRTESALMVLAAMGTGDTMTETYRGFAWRKAGDMDRAMTHYTAALALDADNLLARSYMGQGMVDAGDLVGAHGQLREIAARGGRDSWAFASLDGALRGLDTDY